MKITLSAIPSPLTSPILDGIVVSEDFEIKAHKAKSVDLNSRLMLNQEFDVAEMSFATFLKAREDGIPLIGLPIFTGRRFLQPCISFCSDSNINQLSELKGRRVGIPQYWMTSSVWHRGLITHEYGVSPEDVFWETSTPERLASLQFPSGVNVDLRDSDLQGLQQRLIKGEIDVLLSPRPAKTDGTKGAVSLPFKDIVNVQRDYYERTQILPIMHFVVVREELAKKYPDVVREICSMFQSAKEKVFTGTFDTISPESPITGETFEESKDLFSGDPWPYGLIKNKYVLNTFLTYALEQGLLQRPLDINELFVSSAVEIFQT